METINDVLRVCGPLRNTDKPFVKAEPSFAQPVMADLPLAEWLQLFAPFWIIVV